MKALIGIIIAMLFICSFSTPYLADTDDSIGEVKSTDAVLIEISLLSGCSHCYLSNEAVMELQDADEYEFYPLLMVYDHCEDAQARSFVDYNIGNVPVAFFDGGYEVAMTANEPSVDAVSAIYNASMDSASSRDKKEVSLDIDIEWLGNGRISVSGDIENGGTASYVGRLRIYVAERVSSMGWNDVNGKPYHNVFLDFIYDDDVILPIGGSDFEYSWDATVSDDGSGHSYDGVEAHNLMVVAALFDEEAHSAYSMPPDMNRFDAHYVDAVDGGFVVANTPPSRPSLWGEESGMAGVSYGFTASADDPNGDDLYYQFDWDNGEISDWVGPYASGDDIVESYAWSTPSTYEVVVRAKDDIGDVSGWSDPASFTVTGAKLELSSLSGGFGKLSAKIENTGVSPAEDISWSIEVTGGLVLLDGSKSGVLQSLDAGSSFTMSSDLFLGFGSASATICCSMEGVTSDSMNKDVKLLLLFILL